ncbi:VWA domain-containing protein [Dactylosporangium vinaceum]|uniref:VWA domain-containing protein n=1 Tax=Dactylosporangium vinaceum TaxID=53362 RepID=UPI001CA8803B|nr:extracellular solute-binding protein [Dactylosporangium vinaceum]UAB99504.1 VWA domain-containing protein [Dactylosporangium vinaceum]
MGALHARQGQPAPVDVGPGGDGRGVLRGQQQVQRPHRRRPEPPTDPRLRPRRRGQRRALRRRRREVPGQPGRGRRAGPRHLLRERRRHAGAAGVLYDSGAPDGDPGRIGKGRRPSVPLVAVHPQDGTLMMDHPYAVLASATAEQQAAAADFLAFLREPAQQQRFADLGFRDYQGRAGPALSAAIGLPGAQPPLSLIDPPAPAVLSHMLTGWDELRKKARVLLVMDVSGSMDEPAGGGRTRLEAAKEAAIQGLARLHPDDEVSLWQFSTEDAGGPQPYEQIVPFAAMRDNGERLTAAIKGLHPEGGTALYTTVRAAQRSMLEHYETDRINAIVVLTDGKNEYPRDNDLQALLRDVNADTLERSVRVFAIAFGDKSDLTTLSSIARASRAAAYDARNPSTINDVFISVLSNF